jgi:hypothetical protein
MKPRDIYQMADNVSTDTRQELRDQADTLDQDSLRELCHELIAQLAHAREECDRLQDSLDSKDEEHDVDRVYAILRNHDILEGPFHHQTATTVALVESIAASLEEDNK